MASQQPHILHVVTRLLKGGSEENVVETCRWQAAQDHQVSLVHGRDFDPGWKRICAGIQLIEVPQLIHPIHPVWDIRALKTLRRIYRTQQPDVIHTHQSKAGILGRLASDAVPQARVIHGIHIVPFLGTGKFGERAYIAAERLAARRTDRFIAVSDASVRAFVAAGIARSDRLTCIRSGMDLSRFRQASWPKDWRQLLRLGPTDPKPTVAVMLAAYEARKQHIPFLKSLAKQSLPSNMRLILAGQGPEEGPIRKLIQKLGLDHQVILCGFRPDPECLLALADLSVLASRREGLSRAIVQSIAAGCPILSNHLPGLSEIVQDGVNGTVVSSGNMDGLTSQLVRDLHNPVRLQRLANGASCTDVSAWDLSDLGPATTEAYGIDLARKQAAA